MDDFIERLKQSITAWRYKHGKHDQSSHGRKTARRAAYQAAYSAAKAEGKSVAEARDAAKSASRVELEKRIAERRAEVAQRAQERADARVAKQQAQEQQQATQLSENQIRAQKAEAEFDAWRSELQANESKRAEASQQIQQAQSDYQARAQQINGMDIPQSERDALINEAASEARTRINAINKQLLDTPIYGNDTATNGLINRLQSDNPQSIDINSIRYQSGALGGKPPKLSKKEESELRSLIGRSAGIVDSQGQKVDVNVVISGSGSVHYNAATKTIVIPRQYSSSAVLHETLHAVQFQTGVGVPKVEAFARQQIGSEKSQSFGLNQGERVTSYRDDVPSTYTFRDYGVTWQTPQGGLRFPEVFTTALDTASFADMNDARQRKVSQLFFDIIRGS